MSIINKAAMVNFSDWVEHGNNVQLTEISKPLFLITHDEPSIGDNIDINIDEATTELPDNEDINGNIIRIVSGSAVPINDGKWIILGKLNITGSNKSFYDNADWEYTADLTSREDIDAICKKILDRQKCDFNTFRERYPDLLHIGEHEDEFKGIFE